MFYIVLHKLLYKLCCTLLYNSTGTIIQSSLYIVVQALLYNTPLRLAPIQRAVTPGSGVKIKAPRSVGQESYSDQSLKFQLDHDERPDQLGHPGCPARLVKLKPEAMMVRKAIHV